MKPLCNKCGTTHWETQACETAEQREVRLRGAGFPVSPPAKTSDPDPVLQTQPAPAAPVVTEQVNQTEVPQAPESTDKPITATQILDERQARREGGEETKIPAKPFETLSNGAVVMDENQRAQAQLDMNSAVDAIPQFSKNTKPLKRTMTPEHKAKMKAAREAAAKKKK